MKRKINKFYYNVDTNKWSTETGGALFPTSLPRFSLYEKSLLQINFIRSLGEPYTEFDNNASFSFIVFSSEGTPIVRTLPADINSHEVNMLLPEANAEDGIFGILLDCNTVELQQALLGLDSKRFKVEFVASDGDDRIGTFGEKAQFMNSSMSAEDVQQLINIGSITNGDIALAEGDSFKIVPANVSQYGLLSFYIDAPAESEIGYTVTNVTAIGGSGYKVFFNATIAETGHVLRYSLIRRA